MSALLPYFESVEFSAVGQLIKNSNWAFAVIESIHLLGLAVIGGSVLLVDLRMLGFGLRNQSVSQLARDARPWLIASLIVMLVTGMLLFASEAVKCYYSPPFWVKMTSLLLAMTFTFTVRAKVTAAPDGHVRPAVYRLVALVSLALWFGVGAGGRWIGFSG